MRERGFLLFDPTRADAAITEVAAGHAVYVLQPVAEAGAIVVAARAVER